jgi:hypothetical protein
MPSMRALRFEAYGPPSALSLQDIPVPSLNPGEVLVKVHAAQSILAMLRSYQASSAHHCHPLRVGILPELSYLGTPGLAKRFGAAEPGSGSTGLVLMLNTSSFLLTGFPQSPRRSRWNKQLRLVPHLSLLGLLS